jgi:arylsulfatase A-like enzyme
LLYEFVGSNRLHGWERRLLDDLDQWHSRTYVAPDRGPDAQRQSDSHVSECGPGEHYSNEYDRTALAACYGLISFADDLFGQLLLVIDGSALRENTVVVYLSDHGEMGGHHGFWQRRTRLR